MRRFLYLAVMLLFVGCVDKEMDIAEVEGNIGINADELTFPLAYMEERKLGDILGDAISMDGISTDQDGNYSISYGVDNQSIVVDGAGNTFTIPATTFEVDVDYPSFKLSDSRCTIEAVCDIGGKLGNVDLTLGQTVPMLAGLKLTGVQDGETGYMTDVHLPEYVKRIDRIYVAHDENLPGAPVVATFDLGSLGDVCGGGTVTLELKVPEDYEIYDEQFNRLDDHIFRVENRELAAGEHRVSFTMYIGSIINHHEAENGEIHIPGGIEYHISYDLTTAAGTVALEELPHLELKGELACEDADIVLGRMDLMPHVDFSNTFTFDVFTDAIKSIKTLDLESTSINLFVKGLDWWGEDALMAGALNDIFVEIDLPKSFKVYTVNSDARLDSTTNTLHATLAQLQRGIRLGIDKIDFGSEGIAPGADGKITVNLDMGLRVALEENAMIRMKYLQHEGDVHISAGYDKTRLVVSSVTGRVDFSHNESLSFDVATLGEDIDLEIKGLGISPVIDLSLSNSLTLPLYASASIVPVKGGVEGTGITIDPFEIKAATLGEHFVDIVPTQTKVRIADNPQQEAGVTAIDCSLEPLFAGGLPERLQIDLSVATDPTKDLSLTIVPSYPITYGYNFFLPMAFGKSLDLTYSGTAEGIDQTISDLDLELGVTGKVALICDLENSTPLNLALGLELLDIDGRPTSIQIAAKNGAVIKGSADGKTPQKSTVTFELTSSNKSNLFADLERVETLRYTLQATSAADGVSLNSNQTISGTFALQVDGSVNIKLDLDLTEEE